MKMTLVISSLNAGGAERVLTTLANEWAEKGEDVSLITFEKPEYRPFYSVHPQVKLQHLNLLLDKNKKNFLSITANIIKRLVVLHRLFKKESPALIVSFMDTVNIVTLAASFGTKIPVVISERVDPKRHSRGSIPDLGVSLLRKITYPFAKQIVVQTTQVLNYFPKRLHNRIAIIPNPVSIPPSASTLKADFENKRIIATGRLDKQKGFDLLLNAFAILSPQYPAWELLIWGEGIERATLETLRNRLGLKNHVQFPGITKDIYRELSKGSFFVLSSRYEGFPNALCEAMAIGLPAIAFDCGSGPIDIIRNQVDGILVPAENIDALSKAMQELMNNAEHRRQLGSRASEILHRFSLGKIIEQWDLVNNKALEN